MDASGRLRSVTAEITALGTEMEVIDEQIAFQDGVADDARIRALVSETPLASREAAEAAGDLERMRRTRADLDRRIESLRAEQDRLLERIMAERRRGDVP